MSLQGLPSCAGHLGQAKKADQFVSIQIMIASSASPTSCAQGEDRS